MSFSKLTAAVLCLGCVHNSAADEAVWYAHMSGFGYSEPVAFRQFMTDWSGRISAGNAALLHVQVESGLEYQDWGIGLFWRDDGEARFSEDTAQLYYLLKNKLPLAVGKRYEIDLKINQARSKGMRIFRAIRFDTWATLVLGASVFHSGQLVSGSMRGAITATAAKDYDLNEINVDYYYSRDTLFDREVIAPLGRGFAFDLDLLAHPAPLWTFGLKTENLFGNIFWKSAPFTRTRLGTGNKTYDQNGNVHVQPALSGGYRDYTQRLPLLVDSRISYNLSAAFDAVGVLSYTPVQIFRSAGITWRIGAQTNLAALYTLDADEMTLSAGFARGYLALGADRVLVNKAHALTFAAGFKYPVGDF